MALRKRTDRYWERRANERLLQSEKLTKKYMAELAKVYAGARRQTVRQLQDIYAAYYKRDKGFDMEALNSIVPTNEIKKLIADMKKRGINTTLPENYAGRVKRLELINEQLRYEAQKVALQQQGIDDSALRANFEESYYRAGYDVSRGIGSTPVGFSRLDTQTINQVMSERFMGENYSDRIWANTDLLASRLQKTLAVAIANGQGIQKTARDIRNDYNVNQYYAERLVRTESNHFHNQGELEAYKQMGFEYFQFLATLDNRTSEICQEMDGKKFKVSEGIPGDNVPPLHPNCRSTIVPYFKEYEPETRMYRNPMTGKNEYTYSISYNEWRKDFEEALTPTGKRTVWELIGKKRNSAENTIRKNRKYETLLVIDEKDNVVHAEKGSQHRVYLSDKANRLLLHDGYAASHNHPSCSSFSTADLKTAASHNLRYIRAATKYSTFEVSANGKWPSIDDIERVHDRNVRKAQKEADKWRTKTGENVGDYLWSEITDRAMKKTAKELGLKYKNVKIKGKR